ncbi:Cytochrome P450 4V2 [Aphelenchoides besseyi]|nr:Cytochrome P450 4V2 [Aphelenchoides besseyi]KAI6209786.1 Cytochrome P450 4V2 [Aphelenchoides besseyi]
MGVAVWAIFILILLFSHRFIYERLRIIWYVDQLPGPVSIPIFGTTWQLKWRINDLAAQMREWFFYYKSRQYDMIRVWIGPFPIVCLQSAESVKAILESNTVIRKGDEYAIIERWLGQGLLISRGEKWRSRRKLLTPAFHFNMLNKFQSTHDKEAQILVDQLARYAETNDTFDAYPFLKRCALDIICETSMGVKVNAQTEHHHPYVQAVRRMNELSFTYTRMPWLWIKPIWYGLGYGKEYDTNLKLVTDFTRQVIADRRKSFQPIDFQDSKRQYAFLDLLLSVQKAQGLTDEDLREETDTFMFEGHDTTSSSMSWSLWLLAHKPECQKKIFEEVDRVFGDSNRNCTFDDLKELRYLEQCIKEGLRLFPPVPLFTRKLEEDIECVGYKIPRGVTVLIAPNCVSMDNRYYSTPREFNPDHFTAEASAARHPFAFIPFSAGPRNCIGQKFALMEEKTILSWFFRRYRLSSDIPFDQNIACPEIINKPFLGLPIRIHKRRMGEGH